MHGVDLILTLTGSLGVALVFGYLTNRLGFSPIVGYLLAGYAVGPYTPGFHADQQVAGQLAEVGVILLMFGVGLHFHVEELLAVRRIAIFGAVGQSLAATVLAALAMRAFGWSWSAGVVFGLAISVASTVVLVRVLSDNNDLHTRAGRIAVGWLVMEDIFTVLVLVLLPSLAADESDPRQLTYELGFALLKLGTLTAFIVIIGGRLIPYLLTIVAATRSRELFTLSILVMALGIALGSAKFFGASMALGAFLAGLAVGRSEFSLRAASEALPMRDAFAVLFFVTVGMLFDPRSLWENRGLAAATLGIILVCKPVAAFCIVMLMRYPLRIALALAVALAQIGEFSFMLGVLAKELGILSETATNTLVAAAILSITLNPLLYRSLDRVERWLVKCRPQWGRPGRDAPLPVLQRAFDHDGGNESTGADRVIIVGYGPVGKTLTRLLRENELAPTVIELNLDAVRALRSKGVDAIYGDASRGETLDSAGVSTAVSLILSAAGIRNSEEVIRLARERNPEIRVVARTEYLREVPALSVVGADEVFSGEGEVALAMTESLLRELGATPEQVDRERHRIRTEFFGSSAAFTPSAGAQHLRAVDPPTE